MSTHERTLTVIQSFYDAAMDESLWPAALKDLADISGSQAASFWVLDGSGQPRLPTFISINFDQRIIREYLDHVAAFDPTVQYLVAHPREPIVHDGLVISEREKEKHPYYDWHDRNIDTRFRMVGQTRLTPTAQAGVALHRTRRKGRYEPKDIERFAVLHGHLERALAIAFRLGSLGAMQQMTTEWLDRNAAAVLFLDEGKRIVFANRAAHALLSAGDGMQLSADALVLQRKQDNDRLHALIAQAVSPIALASGSAGGAMRVVRPSGKRSYGIIVAAVSGRYSVLTSVRPVACVVITDPERRTLLASQQLEEAFGLTKAEGRLAAQLATGEDLRSAAEKLRITYGTARSRLAIIFEKTGTRRQGELIRLLLTMLGLH